jgi:hypothetical protein
MTRLAVYVALALLMTVIGLQWNQVEFWCMVGLFWAAEFLNRQEGRQEGVAIVLDMPMMKIAGLKVIMEKVMSGKDVTVKELMDQLEKNKNDL